MKAEKRPRDGWTGIQEEGLTETRHFSDLMKTPLARAFLPPPLKVFACAKRLKIKELVIISCEN